MRPGTKPFAAVFWVLCAAVVVALYAVDAPRWMLFVAVIVFALGWGAAMALWGAGRRRGVARWAQERGWTPAPNGDPSLRALSSLPPFGQGTVQSELDVLRAPGGGWPVSSFTYRWSTPRRDERGNRADVNGSYAHVVAAQLPGQYPYVEVSTKEIRTAGAQPYATGNAEFDRRFHVATTDPAFAAHLLAPWLQDAMVREPFEGRSWRLEGRVVLWWAPGYTRVEVIEPAARLVQGVAGAVAGAPRGA